MQKFIDFASFWRVFSKFSRKIWIPYIWFLIFKMPVYMNSYICIYEKKHCRRHISFFKMKRSVEGYDGSDWNLPDHDPRRCRLRPADNSSVFISAHLRRGMCSQIPANESTLTNSIMNWEQVFKTQKGPQGRQKRFLGSQMGDFECFFRFWNLGIFPALLRKIFFF